MEVPLKTILGLFVLWSPLGLAQEVCSTAYVTTPYLTCSNAENGFDTLAVPLKEFKVKQDSTLRKKNQDGSKVCLELREAYNKANEKRGHVAILASGAPVSVREVKQRRRRGLIFKCELNVSVYPAKSAPSAACGPDSSTVSIVNAQSDLESVKGNSHLSCLTCDSSKKTKDIEGYTRCTLLNVRKVLQATVKAGISDEVISTLQQQVQEIANRANEIKEMKKVEAQVLLEIFNERYSNPKEQPPQQAQELQPISQPPEEQH